jgi:hypothetical protein
MSSRSPRYKSGLEVKVAEQLRKLKSRAVYEPIKLPYVLNLNYIPDWELPSGVIIEAKGKLDGITRRKMLAVKRAHPKRIICLVFQRASNKLYKGSSTTYGEWAEKHGFLWSDLGVVNKDWLRLS